MTAVVISPYFYIFSTSMEDLMQTKPQTQLFHIKLEYFDGSTRIVKVRASSLRVAEDRALKRNPNARAVKRNG